jgi:hypothetical protein
MPHQVYRPPGQRQNAQDVRNQRVKLARDVLDLLVRDAAGMPLSQQIHLKTARRELKLVEAWCERVLPEGGG